MKKAKNKYQILITLIQTLKKFKTKFIIVNPKKNTKLFLEFLWQNQFIYGFTYLISTKILVFLKYNKLGNQLLFSKIKKTLRLKSLQKEIKWSKNTFFILKTRLGLVTIKSSILSKIGGFVLYKIF